MAEWPVMTLKQAGVELIDCVHKTPVAADDGYPYVAIPQMKNGRIDFADARRISPADFVEWTKKARPRLHDVVLSRRTNPGVTATFGTQCDFALGQNLVLLRANGSNVCPEFLRWLVVGPSWWAQISKYNNVGAVFDSLRCADVPKFELPVPPKSDQLAIAAVLSALDDKIEVNRRTNDSLRAIVSATFNEWFIHFGPTRAKDNGGEPAIDGKLSKFFPDTLEPSKIGLVPKGWKVERFDAHFGAERGLSYKGEGLCGVNDGVPMHNLNSVYEGGGYKHEGIKHYAGEYREKHIAAPGDMLVTNTEQGFEHLLIGHAALVPARYGPRTIYSHHIYRVRPLPNSPLPTLYLVELFNSERWHYWISGFSNGTTINMLPLDALQMPLLVVPPDGLVEAFSGLAREAHEKAEANIIENDGLARMRDLLLPSLLSGKVRVRDAEKLLERAV